MTATLVGSKAHASGPVEVSSWYRDCAIGQFIKQIHVREGRAATAEPSSLLAGLAGQVLACVGNAPSEIETKINWGQLIRGASSGCAILLALQLSLELLSAYTFPARSERLLIATSM